MKYSINNLGCVKQEKLNNSKNYTHHYSSRVCYNITYFSTSYDINKNVHRIQQHAVQINVNA